MDNITHLTFIQAPRQERKRGGDEFFLINRVDGWVKESMRPN